METQTQKQQHPSSNQAKSFTEEKNINWWIKPAETPDLNPIEVLRHELKHFIWNTVKPNTKDELKNGIARFWQERLDTENCSR